MELIFKVSVVFTIIQRLAELFWAKRNERIVCSKGGKVLPEKNYLFMVLLHTSWLVSIAYYTFANPLHFQEISFAVFFLLFIIGQTLRITAIATLGERWSTRVMVLPEAPVVHKGIFKFIKHPNYLGVILEIVALPAMGSLYAIGIIFSILNFIILFFRIRFEENMLKTYNDYEQKFG